MPKFYYVEEIDPPNDGPGFSGGFVVKCREPGKPDRQIGNGFMIRSEAEAKRDELQAAEDAKNA